MSSDIKIAPMWESLLEEEFSKPYFIALRKKVREAYTTKKVFPKPASMFRAFDLCAPEHVRVVILGQDPYHTPGVADGLAFSSFPQNPIPPSLGNIFKEIESEFGVSCLGPSQIDEIQGTGEGAKKAYSDMVTESRGPRNEEVRNLRRSYNPDLTNWAEQGVLLLNASLTVESGLANSHADFGWHEFTDAVIRNISEKEEHVVFMLWGNFARAKHSLIDESKHLILASAHPSPLSAHRGFLGNGHFLKANNYLKRWGRGEIAWRSLAIDSLV